MPSHIQSALTCSTLPIPQTIGRRQFLQSAGAAAIALSTNSAFGAPAGKVRLGLITDVHHDHIHDASHRMNVFLEQSAGRELDALIQLGDFARPSGGNRGVIDTFNKAHRRCLHVIGNHDMDGGYSVDQVVDGWGMKSRYYSQDVNGLKVIALDCNERLKGNDAKYPASVGQEQMEWLKAELRHPGPMLIVSHQPLAGSACIDNSAELQQLLSQASDRIVVAMNGHTHIDEVLEIGKVSYWHVNSASYFHVGEKFQHETYPKDLHAKWPALSKMCPYREPLFCFLDIDLASRTVSVAGRESSWLGQSPKELGYPSDIVRTVDKQIVPVIRSRDFKPS